MFGGEYATLDQFHHYRDFWSLDLKTNAWTEIKASGDSPSARSYLPPTSYATHTTYNTHVLNNSL